jgi:hypothetical protein
MTNTVAHISPKPGTARRLGLRLPAPKRPKATGGTLPIRSLIVGPAGLWNSVVPKPGAACLDFPMPLPVAAIQVTNVTARRNGEPVHVSEVIKDLMTNMGLVPRPRPLSALGVAQVMAEDGETVTECCDVLHTFDAAADAWLPGCAHLGSL